MLKKPAKGGMPAMASAAAHHGPEGPGDLLAQAAHVAQVLLARERVDHAARAEEQQRLEERVGHQVVDARRKRAAAHAHEHVAELRNGGIGEDLLDIVLRQADGGGEEGRGDADHRDGRPSPRERARKWATSAPSCRRPPSPWWPRGSAPKPASGRPWRPAARHTAEAAPICRTRPPAAAARWRSGSPRMRRGPAERPCRNRAIRSCARSRTSPARNRNRRCG